MSCKLKNKPLYILSNARYFFRIDQYNEKVNFVKKEQNDDDDTIEVTEDDIGIPVAGMTYREYQYQYGNVDQDYYVY